MGTQTLDFNPSKYWTPKILIKNALGELKTELTYEIEFDRFEKQQSQTVSFDILDKTEMNSDDDDDNVSEWDNTLLDGLENL